MNRYVCDLQYAKRLTELGVKQESEFYWCRGDGFDDRTFKEYTLLDEIAFGKWWGGRTDRQSFYSAFIVGELGERLPAKITQDGGYEYSVYHCRSGAKQQYFMIKYIPIQAHPNNLPGNRGCVAEDTEANARAKMLIYLLENKLIKVEVING